MRCGVEVGRDVTLAALLDIETVEIEKLIAEQFRGKDKLIAPNHKALHMGRDYALANLPCPLGLTLAASDKVGDRIFLDGNTFGSSPSVGHNPFVADLSVGLAINYRNTKLAYAFVYRTKEYKTQREAQIFGTVSLNWTF